jgi:hypothetical protein
MQKITIAIVLGGLALMPLSAMSQDLASATYGKPMAKSEHILFMEKGSMRVPDSAMETIRSAANAAKSSPVLIEGRPEYANAVKQEMLSQGAPAASITVRPAPVQPLARAGDGVSVSADRGVAIRF